MTLEDSLKELGKELDGLVEENEDCKDPDWLVHMKIASLHIGWALKNLGEEK
jgi:hypothetical protein